jgi:hypothetical protein
MRFFASYACPAVVALVTVLGLACADPANAAAQPGSAATKKVNGGTVNIEHGVRVWRAAHPALQLNSGTASCCEAQDGRIIFHTDAYTGAYTGGYAGSIRLHSFHVRGKHRHHGHHGHLGTLRHR